MDNANQSEEEYGKQFIDQLMSAALFQRYEMPKLLKYLVQGSGMPKIQHKPLAPGYHGVYSYDSAVPRDPGSVDISANSVNTMVHELTHAAQKQMKDQAYAGGAGDRFLQGYNKLMGSGPGNGPGAILQRMAPDWDKANKDYRTTPNEAQAHAIGNQTRPPHASMVAPAHVDATLAQEFMILLDLATRDQAAQRKARGLK